MTNLSPEEFFSMVNDPEKIILDQRSRNLSLDEMVEEWQESAAWEGAVIVGDIKGYLRKEIVNLAEDYDLPFY